MPRPGLVARWAIADKNHCGGGLFSNLMLQFLAIEACSIATIWPFI